MRAHFDGGATRQRTMAIKATIYKAHLQIADMDRHLYADHSVTIARHPSETDERMMMRLLAFALNVPADDHGGALEFAKSLWDADEPDLWQKNLTGEIVNWMEVGQPDDKRLLKASGRADRVTVYSYTNSTPIWWNGIVNKVSRAKNLFVWQVVPAESQALAQLTQRSMQLQVTVQDGTAWVGNGVDSFEVTPKALMPKAD
ncbi:MAG: hypothetical protein JWQ11_3706 [Rhizobacter sp.]|nr:hypothetical protein [Rhizobacter sp.]